MGAHLHTDAEIVIAVYRPDMVGLRRIVDSCRHQVDADVRVTMILDGPYEPVETEIAGWIADDPMIRLLVSPAQKSEVRTRAYILAVDSADVLIVLDDDVLPGPTLVRDNIAALVDGVDVVMGRLANDIPVKKDVDRPSALAYDRWYQAGRQQWLHEPESVYIRFWSGNMALRRQTLALIDGFMPRIPIGYNADALYGLVCRELGLKVVYRDDLVATHLVRKSAETVASIGYRSGENAAVMSRALNSVAPDRAALIRQPIERMRRGAVSRWVLGVYDKHPAKVRDLLVAVAEKSNAMGLDSVAYYALEAAQLLERHRAFMANDHPNDRSDAVESALLVARAHG